MTEEGSDESDEVEPIIDGRLQLDGLLEQAQEEQEDLQIFTNQENNNTGESTTPPASPGMGYLLEEDRILKKRPKKNKKYNQSFDLLKEVITEVLPQFDKVEFERNLRTSYNFVNLMRKGLPENLHKFLSNSALFDLELIEKSSRPVSNSTSNISSSTPPPLVSSSSSTSYIHENIGEVPENFKNEVNRIESGSDFINSWNWRLFLRIWCPVYTS